MLAGHLALVLAAAFAGAAFHVNLAEYCRPKHLTRGAQPLPTGRATTHQGFADHRLWRSITTFLRFIFAIELCGKMGDDGMR